MATARTARQRGRMSRNKGKVFERTVANTLKLRGIEARRSAQFDGAFGHDLTTELPINFECKAVENLNLRSAYEQAVADSTRANTLPVVIHKKNNQTVMATLSFSDFIDLLQWGLGYVDEYNTLDLKEFREKFMEKKRIELTGEELL